MDLDANERKRRRVEAVQKFMVGLDVLQWLVIVALLIAFGLYRWLSSVELFTP